MSYVKPGVEITQVQKTVGPTLNAPTLFPAVIGPAFHVVEVDDYTFPVPYNSGISTNDYDLTTATGDAKLDLSTMKLGTTVSYVWADIIYTSGLNIGRRKHVSSADITVTAATGNVRIGAGYDCHNGFVTIGYRALKVDKNKLLTFENNGDLSNQFGEANTTTLNPLGFAVQNALANAATKQVYGFGLLYDDYSLVGSGSVTPASAHNEAKDVFAVKEIYTYAVVSNDKTELDKYITQSTTYSAATEKKERIALLCPEISWTGGVPATTNKATDAANIAALGVAQGEKRATYIFPDTGYVLETRHILTLKPEFVQAVYSLDATVYAVLAETVTLSANHPTTAWVSKKIYAETEITSTIYTLLLNDPDRYTFKAYVPVHNGLFTAGIAGQIANLQPEQPLTNVPLRGISRVKFASDWFTETNLNSIAQGGIYILNQSTPNASVMCRHQLTTDMTTIQTRELNIVKTVDYVAKFIRNAVSPYIGRRVIDDQFLAMLTAVINALGQTLVREGHLSSFTLASLAQDTVNQDTVRATINIVPKYPVNYIKIDLVF